MTAFDPAPTTLAEVTSPEWLSAMLGATVRNVEIVETLVTMATKVRLKFDVEGGDAEVQTALCIKGILTKTEAHASASIVETLFYQDAADSLGIRVPERVHASLNAAGDNGVLVMWDQIAAGGHFCSALEPFTPEEAIDGLDELVKLHIAGWQGNPVYDTPWIPRFLDRFAGSPVIPLDMLQGLLDGPRGEPLPNDVLSAERLMKGLGNLAAQVRELPNTLVHGDAHAGNVYRTAEGKLGIVDWQILQKGEWAQDVAYHLAAVLTPEDRRAHERRLLDHYLGRLKALGGPAIDPEEAWTRYRAGMVYGYFLWSITRKVDPPVIHEFVRRLGLAVSDLDSYAVVGA